MDSPKHQHAFDPKTFDYHVFDGANVYFVQKLHIALELTDSLIAGIDHLTTGTIAKESGYGLFKYEIGEFMLGKAGYSGSSEDIIVRITEQPAGGGGSGTVRGGAMPIMKLWNSFEATLEKSGKKAVLFDVQEDAISVMETWRNVATWGGLSTQHSQTAKEIAEKIMILLASKTQYLPNKHLGSLSRDFIKVIGQISPNIANIPPINPSPKPFNGSGNNPGQFF